MLGSPVASVFVGFGNVGEKFGATSFGGAWAKLALRRSFSFWAVLTLPFVVSYSVRLCPTTFCAFLGGEGRLTYGRLFSAEPRFLGG